MRKSTHEHSADIAYNQHRRNKHSTNTLWAQQIQYTIICPRSKQKKRKGKEKSKKNVD